MKKSQKDLYKIALNEIIEVINTSWESLALISIDYEVPMEWVLYQYAKMYNDRRKYKEQW